jgi:uncharacterized membrane protein YczE
VKIFAYRFFLLNLGLFVFAVGLYFSIQSGLGFPAWDVLHQGISLHSPLTLGQASQLSGLLIIGITWWMGEKPGIGTVCNMFFIGLWLDVLRSNSFLSSIPQDGLLLQLIIALAGIAIVGLGSGLYVKANMGAGPRDSLMIALVRITGLRVSIVRICLELIVVIAGWLMGGLVGVGTVLFAFGIGPAVEIGFKLCRVEIKRGEHLPEAPLVTVAGD